VTAYALLADNTRSARIEVKDYSLMATILTGNLTTATAYTPLAVNLRKDHGVTVKVGRQDK